MAKHDINFPIQLATVRIASFTLNFVEISTVLEKHDTKVQYTACSGRYIYLFYTKFSVVFLKRDTQVPDTGCNIIYILYIIPTIQ